MVPFMIQVYQLPITANALDIATASFSDKRSILNLQLGYLREKYTHARSFQLCLHP